VRKTEKERGRETRKDGGTDIRWVKGTKVGKDSRKDYSRWRIERERVRGEGSSFGIEYLRKYETELKRNRG
jgi:hypothetical protein